MTAHEPSACFVIGSAVVFQPLNSPARATEEPSPFHTKVTPAALAWVAPGAPAAPFTAGAVPAAATGASALPGGVPPRQPPAHPLNATAAASSGAAHTIARFMVIVSSGSAGERARPRR